MAFSFGARPSTPAAPSSFAFGGSQSSTTSTAQASTAGGLFGASKPFGVSTTTPAASTGLFGSSTAAAAPTGGSFPSLGTSATVPAAPSMFGTGMNAPLGGLAAAQAPTLGALSAPIASAQPGFSKATKYNDLPADVQKKLDEFNKTVQEQRHLAEQLDIAYTAYVIDKNAKEIESVIYKLSSIKNLLERNMQLVAHLKKNTMKEMDNEEMANRLFDSMMKHGGPGSVGVAERPFFHPQDYIWRYFCETYAVLESRIVRYRSLLDDLEKQLSALVHPADQGGASVMSPQMALEVMKNNYETFLGLAAKVAAMHDQLEGQKELFLQWQRSRTDRPTENPFEPKLVTKKTDETVSGGTKIDSLLARSTFADMAKRIAAKSEQAPTSSAGSLTSSFPAPSSVGGSIFGAKPGMTTSTTSSLFNNKPSTSTTPSLFGNGTAAPSTTSSFGFGSTQPSTTPAAASGTPSFGFGGTSLATTGPAAPTASGAPSFGFGASSSATNNAPQAPGGPTGATSSFNFGASTSSTPAFGAQQQPAAAPSFAFGGFKK